MIKGIGIDMIETARIGEKISKENGFRELVFSSAEIAYCESKAHPVEHFAARFAAKEAFFKAIGTGWINGTAFNEIEIGHDESGCPKITLLGESVRTLAQFSNAKIFVSLTHLKASASALVIIETI